MPFAFCKSLPTSSLLNSQKKISAALNKHQSAVFLLLEGDAKQTGGVIKPQKLAQEKSHERRAACVYPTNRWTLCHDSAFGLRHEHGGELSRHPPPEEKPCPYPSLILTDGLFLPSSEFCWIIKIRHIFFMIQ
jgi:hypothetical protein